MSVNTGTLQQRAHHSPSLWPALIALIAVATLAAFVAYTQRDSGREASTLGGIVRSIPNVTANTPSELSGGLAGSIPDTLANTPSELRGGFAEIQASEVGGQIGRRYVTPRVGVVVPNANTPSELSGGLTVGGETDAQFHPLP